MPLEGGDRPLAEVERLGADRERAAAQPGEVEKVADEPLEPPCLALDHPRRSDRLQDAVLEGLRMAADRGQRGLELVADGEQERPLRILCARELVREVVERRGERRCLPWTGHRQRLGMLTRRERTAGIGHAGDRPRDGTGEEQRDDPRQRRSHEPGEAEPEREGRPVGGLPRRGAEEHDRLVAVAAGGIEEARPADVDAPAREGARADPPRARAREQQLGLGGREDRESLLVGREEPSQLDLRSPRGLVAPLRGDQLDLPLERVDRRLLERASREQRSCDHRHDERHEHRPGDAQEEAGAQAQPGTSL